MAGTYSYRIASRDLDFTGRARLCAIGELVLEAAGEDADALGFGVGDLGGNSCGDSAVNASAAGRNEVTKALGSIKASWVLSRVAMELSQLPVRGEKVDIYTWVSDYGRMVTTRNMVISGLSGAIGYCVSQWAMIDLTTRRPIDLSVLANKSSSLVDREPPIEKPVKVVGLGDGFYLREYKVAYSDIDFNGHVNSMKYLEWMVDMLPVDALNDSKNVRIDLNYLHEARLGEVLSVIHHYDDKNTHTFDIRNAESAAICRGAIKFSA